MKNKLKEFKQYCEQQICKIQDKYDLNKLQFNKNDKIWVIDKNNYIESGFITEFHFNSNKNFYLYSVDNGYDIDTYISGDDLFLYKEDAEQIVLYKSILKNTIRLMSFEK